MFAEKQQDEVFVDGWDEEDEDDGEVFEDGDLDDEEWLDDEDDAEGEAVED
jgi:hypothetical protein